MMNTLYSFICLGIEEARIWHSRTGETFAFLVRNTRYGMFCSLDSSPPAFDLEYGDIALMAFTVS